MGSLDKIKEAEFESLTKQFNDISKDIKSSLDRIKVEMGNIDGHNETWRGKTANKVIENYKIYEGSFDDINSKLADFGSYLEKTLDNYRRAMQKSQNTVEKTEENFDIN